ncbi:MAG: hypothetical protein NTX68_00415 [Rhodococcus sp.]|nr:hypothetical protein [Rhodococcus sp. (in: high G+C Gram-positive bacteria)]
MGTEPCTPRLFSIAGRISTHAHSVHLKLPKTALRSALVVTALT